MQEIETVENFRRLKEPTMELFRTGEGMAITVSERIPTEEYDALWEMVETGFQDLNRKSYEKQDMSREELEADLDSERVLKYVARDAEGSLIGLLTVHVGLDAISWTDTDELKRVQDEASPGTIPYYVGTLVVPVTERGSDAASNLIKGALVHFQQDNSEHQRDALVFFDCADANYPWLGRLIQGVGTPSAQFPDLNTQVNELYVDAWVEAGGEVRKVHQAPADIEGDVLDKQHYYAISIDRKPLAA